MCRQALAQPQPITSPTVARFPASPAAGAPDTAVDIGLWQEYDTSTNDSGTVVPQKVFVLGTTTVSGVPQLTLARYSLSGGLEASTTWPGTYSTDSFRAAKAMTIPIVPTGTTAGETPQIYVAALVDGAAATSDIAVLAYNFNLKLLWMKTYNYVDPTAPYEWFGDDEPVAITTDQSLDIMNGIGGAGLLDYSIIAVLGSSQGYSTGKDWVTLAYNKNDGCQIMEARHASSGNATDTPIDVACGREAVYVEGSQLGYTAIFATGTSPGASNGGYPEYYTTAYAIFGDTCLTSTGNGTVALGWPRTYGGASGRTSTPARIKYLKQSLYLTGTTQTTTGGNPDMLTLAYNTLATTSPYTDPIVAQMDFHEAGTTTSRADHASDLELFWTHPVVGVSGSVALIAVTGSSTGSDPAGTGIATQLYDAGLNAMWDEGALWTRTTGSGNDDQGLRLQMVDSDYHEAETDSRANIYVTGKSYYSTGNQYVSLKYGVATFQHSTSVPFKPTSWTAANIPNTFYSNSGTSGNHIPARIAVQRSLTANSTTPRRIFIAGTSPGGTSADDWATMFTSEQ